MRTLTEYQLEKRTNWLVGLSVVSLFGSIPLAYGIYMGIPPKIYLFFILFCGLIFPTFILGFGGLKSRSKQTRVYTIISLVFATIATAFFVPIAINGFRTSPVKITLKQIEESVGPACSGEIIFGTTEYKPGEEDYSIIAFNSTEGEKNYPFSFNLIPEKFWPASITEVELVLCLGDEYEDKIQGCGYTNGIAIKRYQYKREAHLVSVWNGEIISKGIIEGSIPKECPEVTSKGGSLKGDKPGVNEVNRWLEVVLKQ